MSVLDDYDRLETWIKEARAAMKKAIETGDVTGLKEVINDLRKIEFLLTDTLDRPPPTPMGVGTMSGWRKERL